MSRKARHQHILDQAKQAAIAAIGCYNQPNFCYREESFCILMINAWELLLKAKIVKDNNEKLQSIYVVDRNAKRKDGKPYAKPKYVKNKANNYITIGFTSILKKHSDYKLNLDNALLKQLETLYELRNASIHLANNGLGKISLEVFTATLQSFQSICELWFNEKATDKVMLIPLAFEIPDNFSSSISSEEAQKLLTFIATQEKGVDVNSKHSIRVNVEIKFERSKSGIPVNTSGNGIPIHIDSEERFKNKYPWNFTDDLIPKLQDKYPSFKRENSFWEAIRILKTDSHYCGERYLDWNKKQGTKKWFYSPDIVPVLAKRLGLNPKGGEQ